MGKYSYLHFVFEFVKVLVFVFKYYSEYLTPTLLGRLARHLVLKHITSSAIHEYVINLCGLHRKSFFSHLFLFSRYHLMTNLLYSGNNETLRGLIIIGNNQLH